MKSIVFIVSILWFAVQNPAAGQLKYLPEERPDFAVGLSGGLAKNADAKSSGYGFSIAMFKILEIGVTRSYDKIKYFDEILRKTTVKTISPYIEVAPSRKPNKIMSIALNLSYLYYSKYNSYLEAKVVTASISFYRDVRILKSFYWFPEAGVAKPIVINGNDIKPIFTFASGLVYIPMRQVEVIVVPQIGIQSGKATRGISFGLAVSS